MKQDYDKLEVERAKMAASVDAARSLVAQWMGGGNLYDDDDETDIKGLSSSTNGLGSTTTRAPPRLSLAMQKLKAAADRQALNAHKTSTNGKVNGHRGSKRAQDSQSEDEEDERPSERATKRKKAVSVLDTYRNSKGKKGSRPQPRK